MMQTAMRLFFKTAGSFYHQMTNLIFCDKKNLLIIFLVYLTTVCIFW